MDKIIIHGGNPLNGSVKVSGAKNAALPTIAACLLSGGDHHLKNIPNLRDIRTIKDIMGELGVVFHDEGSGFGLLQCEYV